LENCRVRTAFYIVFEEVLGMAGYYIPSNDAKFEAWFKSGRVYAGKDAGGDIGLDAQHPHR
jgi:hypothetical protein